MPEIDTGGTNGPFIVHARPVIPVPPPPVSGAVPNHSLVNGYLSGSSRPLASSGIAQPVNQTN